MADDFYPFVDSGDPAPDNRHITGLSDGEHTDMANAELGAHADQAKTPQRPSHPASQPCLPRASQSTTTCFPHRA